MLLNYKVLKSKIQKSFSRNFISFLASHIYNNKCIISNIYSISNSFQSKDFHNSPVITKAPNDDFLLKEIEELKTDYDNNKLLLFDLNKEYNITNDQETKISIRKERTSLNKRQTSIENSINIKEKLIYQYKSKGFYYIYYLLYLLFINCYKKIY